MNGSLQELRHRGRSQITRFNYQNIPNLPKSLDWRLKGAVNPIKRQNCGDCYAFGSTAAIEGHYQIASGELLELSEQ